MGKQFSSITDKIYIYNHNIPTLGLNQEWNKYSVRLEIKEEYLNFW